MAEAANASAAPQQTAPQAESQKQPAAPSAGQAPPEGQPKASSLPSLDEILKQTKLKYKAGGQERVIDSAEVLMRKLSQLDGVEATKAEVLKAKKEQEEFRTKLAKLKSDTPDERLSALQEVLGDDALDLAAELVHRQFQKEQELEKLSPEARMYQQALEKERSEKQRLMEMHQARENEQRQAQEKMMVERARQYVEGVAVKALEATGLPKEVAPALLGSVSRYIRNGVELGVEISPEEAAEAAVSDAVETFGKIGQHLPADKIAGLIGNAGDRFDGPQLRALIGEAGLKKLRQLDLEDYKKGGFGQSTQEGRAKQSDVVQSITPKDRWDRIDEILRSR